MPVCLTIDVKMVNEDRQRAAGKYLKTEREKADVPQKIVADKVPIHVVQLSRIENGHSGARRETIIEIVSVINKNSKTGHQLNLDETLLKFGHAPSGENSEDELTAEIVNDLRISLHGGGKNLTKAQKQKIIDTAVLVARGFVAENERETESSN